MYLGIPTRVSEDIFPMALEVIKTFTSKEFLQQLMNYDIFYDIPPYQSISLDGIFKNI